MSYDVGMSWATQYIAELRQGRTTRFRPFGNSMVPIVKSGQMVTVVPVGDQSLAVGDVVLCHVSGNDYLHLVKAVHGDLVQIGNNRGRINGWTSRKNVFGKMIAVED